MVLEAAQIILSDESNFIWSSPLIHTVAQKGHHYIGCSLHYKKLTCVKKILCDYVYLIILHVYMIILQVYINILRV